MQREDWDKISSDYYTEILSPIKNSKEKILMNDLKSIENSKSETIIDLGCGTGEIEKFLSENFKEVIAIDFSKEMIKNAQEKNKNLGNVKFQVADMLKLKNSFGKFDVALAINSIITPNIKNINKIFRNINKILKKGGKFFCVVPAMEIYAYQSLIIAEMESKKNFSYKKMLRKVKKAIPEEEHDFLLGITDFEGRQKNYYRFEILWRLKKAGFKNIQIKKIFYSWKEFEKAGQRYFPKEDLPWDWYAVCEK